MRHALSAERNRVEIVSIDGFEYAGHLSEADVGGLVLIPVIASGGSGDGCGFAGALAMGAEGVDMGTRFCGPQGAPIHANIKQIMVAKPARDRNIIFRTLHNSGRVRKNAIADEVVATESRLGGCEFKDIHHLVKGVRGREALERGAIDDDLAWGGQLVGLIDDAPTCHEVIQRMMPACRERLLAASSIFG